MTELAERFSISRKLPASGLTATKSMASLAWRSGRVGRSLRGQQKKFNRFRAECNEDRPHEALGMKCPAELYQSSSRQLPKKIEAYDYPGHFLVRWVSRVGTIWVFRKQLLAMSTLQEECVGLEEMADGVCDLYFCFYQIGRYELREERIRDIVSRMAVSAGRWIWLSECNLCR